MQIRPRRSMLYMPRPCTICGHANRELIEKALLDGGAGYRTVARRFGISPQSLFRHRREHLPQLIAKGLAGVPATSPEDRYASRIAEHHVAREERQDRLAIDTVQQLRAINAACLEVLRKAREDGQPLILLRAVDRIVRQIELQARLLGQIQDAVVVNVAVLPEWLGIRQKVLEALRPFPEARHAVVAALKGGDR